MGRRADRRAVDRNGRAEATHRGRSDARYVPTGHIVYASGGTLFAVPFDLAKLEVTGGAVPVVEGVRRAQFGSDGSAQFAISDSGSLVYVPGPASAGQQDLVLFDRKGGAEPLELPPGRYDFPRVSPDGKRIAFETNDGKEAVVSIYELSGASSVRRLTFGGQQPLPDLVRRRPARDVSIRSRRAIPPCSGSRSTAAPPSASRHPTRARRMCPSRGLPTARCCCSARRRTSSRRSGRSRSGSESDAVRRREGFVASDQRDVLTRRPLGGVPDRRSRMWLKVRRTSSRSRQPGEKYQMPREVGGRCGPATARSCSSCRREIRFMVVGVTTAPSFTFTNPVDRCLEDSGWPSSDSAYVRHRCPTAGSWASGRRQSQSGSGPAQIHVVLNWFEELKARAPTK